VETARRPAIAVQHLTKRFGERVAFDDVSFEIQQGEVFGFLGPNGAGKTTTVRTLGTLLAPSGGSATVAGIALTPENGEAIRRRIAVMPESPGLYSRLTVRENLECFVDLYEVDDGPGRISRALEAVNLSGRAGDITGTLSKGLRQRVGLARAILSDPEILFLDEPTAGLDPVAAREVHELVAGLRGKGVTIFLTTHRLEEAERLCDRVAILNTTLRTIGKPSELRDRLFSPTLSVVTKAPLPDPGRTFDALPGVSGWQPGAATDGRGAYELTATDPDAAAPAATRALVETGADVISIGQARRSLEDVYLELVDEDVEVAR
jgi:ABC-2 type transport system ATP-binding protein